MSSRMCNQCGCTDIDIDSTRGDAVCTGCGSVLEDQIIVSEVQFQENTGGGSSLIGQFVSSEGPKSLSIGGNFVHGMQKESRTITLQNGKRKIQSLAAQMKLNQHCVDTAFNFFKMAVAKRMTRGRKSLHVVAACLYLVCRAERTPHMLLDFSDILQVNVFDLGRVYLHLSRELCINLPDVDPCLYIPRFAHALEFGENTHEVSMTAMRLVQRMKRDWMSTGRRPSGLCGAALLVASRIHDFSRSVKEIVKVVKVCQATLRKRLYEFEDTPSSQLTIEEFQNIDLEEEHDPPSYTEGKRKAKKEQSRLPEYTSEISKLQEEIEETLYSQKPRGIWAAYAKIADNCDSDTSRVSEPSKIENDGSVCTANKAEIDTNEFPEIENDGSVRVTNKPEVDQNKLPDIENHVVDSVLNNSSVEPALSSVRTAELTSLSEEKVSDSSVSRASSPTSDSADKIPDTIDIANEVIVGSEVNVIGAGRVKGEVNSALGLGMTEIVTQCLTEGAGGGGTDEGTGELDLTGIDDAEIEKYFLSEKEVLMKTKIWMAENAEFLEEQRIKEEKKAREAEEEAKKPQEKKRRRTTKKPKTGVPEAASAQEVIQKIMQEKRISCKINYDVLNDLNTKSARVASPMVVTPFKIENTKIGSILENKPSIARLRKASVSFDLTAELNAPSRKRVKIEPMSMLPNLEQKPVVSEVVVESGPVQYVKDEAYGEEEEEETGDYYEEEDQHLSAAQLLGHTGAEEDDYELD